MRCESWLLGLCRLGHFRLVSKKNIEFVDRNHRRGYLQDEAVLEPTSLARSVGGGEVVRWLMESRSRTDSLRLSSSKCMGVKIYDEYASLRLD